MAIRIEVCGSSRMCGVLIGFKSRSAATWGCVSTILWMMGQLWTCDERAGVGKRRLGSSGREEKKRGGKRRNVRKEESRGEGGRARSGGAGPYYRCLTSLGERGEAKGKEHLEKQGGEPMWRIREFATVPIGQPQGLLMPIV